MMRPPPAAAQASIALAIALVASVLPSGTAPYLRMSKSRSGNFGGLMLRTMSLARSQASADGSACATRQVTAKATAPEPRRKVRRLGLVFIGPSYTDQTNSRVQPAARTGLFSGEMQDDFSLRRTRSMLEKIDALPGAEHELPVHDRNAQVHLGQGRLQMRRHVVGTFVVVLIESRTLRRELIEELLQVATHGRRRVLLDDEGRGSVPAEQRQQSGTYVLLRHPRTHVVGEFMKAAARRADA